MDKNHNGKRTHESEIPRKKLKPTAKFRGEHQKVIDYQTEKNNESPFLAPTVASSEDRMGPTNMPSLKEDQSFSAGSTQPTSRRCSCSERSGALSREPPKKNQTLKESSLKSCSLSSKRSSKEYPACVAPNTSDKWDSFSKTETVNESCLKAAPSSKCQFFWGLNPSRRKGHNIPKTRSSVRAVECLIPRNDGSLNLHSRRATKKSDSNGISLQLYKEVSKENSSIESPRKFTSAFKNSSSSNSDLNLMSTQKEMPPAIPEDPGETPAEGAMLSQMKPIRCGVEEVKKKPPRSPRKYGRGYIIQENLDPQPGIEQWKDDELAEIRKDSNDKISPEEVKDVASPYVCKGRVCQSKEQKRMLLEAANDSNSTVDKSSDETSNIWISLDFICPRGSRSVEQEHPGKMQQAGQIFPQNGAESRQSEKIGMEKALTTLGLTMGTAQSSQQTKASFPPSRKHVNAVNAFLTTR